MWTEVPGTVGKFKTEQEYIDKKVNELNASRQGKGDKWLINWNKSKKSLYEPFFLKAIQKQLKKFDFHIDTTQGDSKYSMRVHTLFLEQGWYGYLYIAQPSQVDLEITFYDNSDITHEIARLKMTDIRGSGGAPASAYGEAGIIMGKQIKRILKNMN